MNVRAANALAQSFKSLHVPGKPLLLANIYDPSTARAVASLPGCKALATASVSIALAVVGVNLEDSEQKTHTMMDEAVAVQRIKRALAAAAEVGVPDFVVNARSDSFLRGGSLDESIRRGKLYLGAGATTVYVLNG